VNSLLTQEETIWPYIERGIQLKITGPITREEYLSELMTRHKHEMFQLLAVQREDVENKIKDKLTKFADTAPYVIYDPESTDVIEKFGPDISLPLSSLIEQGYLKPISGTRQEQAHEFITLIHNIKKELTGDVRTKRISKGLRNFEIQKPFAISKILGGPEFAYEPAAAFRKIRRKTPEIFDELTSYIAGL
jgi:hypothetical protein